MTRKARITGRVERSNVSSGMWRKKVDNSLFRYGETPIPAWVAEMWSLQHNNDVKNSYTEFAIKIKFQGSSYDGNIRSVKTPSGRRFRLRFEHELIEELKKTFPMSYMRDLEAQLQGGVDNIEYEIPFWEFLDIEYQASSTEVKFTAHYTQSPLFKNLFSNLIGSASLNAVEDLAYGKQGFRIHKQNWKPVSQVKKELSGYPGIYMLIDNTNKSLYIGEAVNIRKRLLQHLETDRVTAWDHYRFDILPKNSSKEIRLQIERMLIRSYASLLNNSSTIPSQQISEYKLLNKKIDH